MACNSVATSSTQIAQINLSAQDLQDMLAKLVGVDRDVIRVYDNGYGTISVSYNDYNRGLTYQVRQSIEETTELGLYMQSSGDMERVAFDKLSADMQTKFALATVRTQQSAVLKRLAQLGKLSNVASKSKGVTARLEITI